MLREGNIQTLNWADKTMTGLRSQQLEACEERLAKLPHYGLFGGCDDTHAEELWWLSYDAQEHPLSHQLHTARQLQAQILIQLPAEAALLSIPEELLVDRLLSLEGTADLLSWDEMDAAESLVRRLWCTLTHEGDTFTLHMPSELRTPLMLATSNKVHQELRIKLHTFNLRIRGVLYLCGLVPEVDALSLLTDMVLKDSYANHAVLAKRFLRASYDFTYDRQGRMLLLHPGLADPERLLRQRPLTCAQALEMDVDTQVHATMGLLQQEESVFNLVYGLLDGALRPELYVEDAVEDLRMLVKQGVPLAELSEVLSSMLVIMPTPAMLDCLKLLLQMTPRWGSAGTGLVQ